jgi:hypothetical protein
MMRPGTVLLRNCFAAEKMLMWVDLAASGFEAAPVVDNLAISDWQLAISQTARYLVFGSWYLVNLSVKKDAPRDPESTP